MYKGVGLRVGLGAKKRSSSRSRSYSVIFSCQFIKDNNRISIMLTSVKLRLIIITSGMQLHVLFTT